MIRLALIGCGAWGWRYIPAALEAGNCVVTHVAGVGKSCPDEGIRHLSGLQIVAEANIAALLALDVDAYVVATPPSNRVDLCCALLDEGRPVMVEKPLALSFDEADEISGAAYAARTPFLVNHQHLFAPAYELLREHAAKMQHASIISQGKGPGPVRSYTALWDYGPHDIAMVLGLRDDAMLVGAKRIGDGSVSLHLRGERSDALVYLSNVSPTKRRRLAVFSDESVDDEKSAVYDDTLPLEKKLRIDRESIDISPEKPLTRAVRAFAEACRTDRTDWRFRQLGADVVEIIEQAQAMLNEEREVQDAADH